MAINWKKVKAQRHDHPALLFESGNPGVVMDKGMWSRGYTVSPNGFRNTDAKICVYGLNGNGNWKDIAYFPHDHARALAYLLLLATAGPLERAAVIADARAEGIEIGGITSTTPSEPSTR